MTIDIHINRRKNRQRQHQKQLAARPITYLEGVAWIPLQDGEHALATDTPHNRTLIEGRLWSLHPRGYVVSLVNGKLEYLHRVLVPGVKMLDHRNGVKTDCRAENLRVCTPSQNASNRPAQKGRRLKGAYLTSTGRYTASIGHNRRTIHLGTFDTEEQAAKAYDAAALKLHGSFAHLNYPEAATCH